jgi:hypothetical protein
MQYCCAILRDESERGCPFAFTHRKPIFYDAIRRSYAIIMEEDETKMDEEDP